MTATNKTPMEEIIICLEEMFNALKNAWNIAIVTGDTIDALREKIKGLEHRVKDLEAGNFTEKEIQNFCHNLHGKVDADGFAEGCRQEMMKLYGQCPWHARIIKLETALRQYGNHCNWMAITGNKTTIFNPSGPPKHGWELAENALI